MHKLTVFALSLLLTTSLIVVALPALKEATAQSSLMDFYVAAEYDFGGSGYNVFLPQTLVVQQGDQVNITVRNVGTDAFQFNLESQNSISIQPGSQNATGIEPADTAIPVFTASSPGILTFSTDKFPEMNGQLVVLPSDPASYNPSSQTRSFTQLVLPDFAGDGYDKFFPGIMVVNQGDTVNVSIRNTDDMPHGFAIAEYDLNVAVNPGQDLPDGGIAPLTTAVQPFTASKGGIFSFLCTTPCGTGHFEMVGQLIVLPTKGSVNNPDILTMYSYLTVKPDFAGDGYDKYVPDTIFVNQGDLVYIKVRNTDTMTHGFSLPAYGIQNETITAAQNASEPTDTYITAFFVDQPGIYEFFCTIYCGPGHDQMIGYLVVLPTQNATNSSPSPSITSITGPLVLYVGLSVALIIIGLVLGVIVAAIFGRQKMK
jgi:heme/copper-type cytochrome/quinol oxidase subunit 2